MPERTISLALEERERYNIAHVLSKLSPINYLIPYIVVGVGGSLCHLGDPVSSSRS